MDLSRLFLWSFILIGSIGLYMYYTVLLNAIHTGEEEGFSANNRIPIQSANITSQLGFRKGTHKNPFSNVLLTDIVDRPDRGAAPPAFNPDVKQTIKQHMKQIDQHANPGLDTGIMDTDLYADAQLEYSMMPFYSMPNTQIVNDQTAFANLLYGGHPSSKESNFDGDVRRYENAHRHIMI